jgi:hypothetical protein
MMTAGSALRVEVIDQFKERALDAHTPTSALK